MSRALVIDAPLRYTGRQSTDELLRVLEEGRIDSAAPLAPFIPGPQPDDAA